MVFGDLVIADTPLVAADKVSGHFALCHAVFNVADTDLINFRMVDRIRTVGTIRQQQGAVIRSIFPVDKIRRTADDETVTHFTGSRMDEKIQSAEVEKFILFHPVQ